MEIFILSFYRKKILPWLINASMQEKELEADRAIAAHQAVGVVLEIGAGSGLNLPFYSANLTKLFALDPSRELWALAQDRLKSSTFPVEFLHASAEHIPLSDASVDTVVSTWSFCSIPDPVRTLQEVRRVLKSNGRLIFVEHGRAPEEKIARWQRRLDPIWSRVSGGCHLSRKIDELLLENGFNIQQLDQTYRKGRRHRSKLFTYFYSGIAIKK